jgi:ABC-type proline/glycine betaine transport system ATPase subunit
MRALAADPPIVLVDEPFGALDPLTRRRLQDEFVSLKARLGKTVVLVTHDVEEAFRLADRIAVMDDGTVLQLGTPAAIRAAPASPFVAAFVGGTVPALS